jgi:hypothetical protein
MNRNEKPAAGGQPASGPKGTTSSQHGDYPPKPLEGKAEFFDDDDDLSALQWWAL